MIDQSGNKEIHAINKIDRNFVFDRESLLLPAVKSSGELVAAARGGVDSTFGSIDNQLAVPQQATCRLAKVA